MKKCKHCLEAFQPFVSTQKYCFKTECTEVWVTEVKRKEAERKQKAWNKEKSKRKVTSDAYRKLFKATLQREINKLAKLIDQRFNYTTCIDCNKPFGKQVDAGHFTSVGANETLRYNLHNIHSQKSDCNQNGLGGGKRLEYLRGLTHRYGELYAQYVEVTLNLDYPLIKLTSADMDEKIKLVRKLIRGFDTMEFNDAIHARKILNRIIGIYK